jgi:hypothetical protein
MTDRQNRTGKQDRLNWTGRIGHTEQDRQDKTGRTGQATQKRTCQLEKDSQNGTDRTRLP